MEASQSSRPPAGGENSTWIAFAGVMLVILGFLDAIWGLAAILNDEVVVVGGHGALIFDITAWGWVQLILGVVIGLTGLGLLVGNEVARVLGIFLLAINAILQVVWFPAAPLWAFLMIILDVVIIYQLTVNWTEQEVWPMPLADISFGEGLLFIFEFFLLFAWIWILISIIGDLFRDHELSGVAKAVWVFFLVFLPFLGVLLYLIVRGNGMRDRTIKAQADAKKEFDSYVREQAQAGSPADELHKLTELKEKGALRLEEFDQAKAKLLA